MVDFSQLTGEEKLLIARIRDLTVQADRGRAAFSHFLNEHQQALAEEAMRRWKWKDFSLEGGYPGAARKMLGAFPSWMEPDEADYPLSGITVRLPKGGEASHRDVLGSLLSLGITRERVGDILTGLDGNRCGLFVEESLASMVVEELVRIGGLGVQCSLGLEVPPLEERVQPLRGTVKSPRVDALVSLLTGLSREKSAALIQAERVRRNHMEVRSLSDAFSPGDVISIRGYGKYRVDGVGGPTKKGRLPVDCSKFI